MESLKFVLVLWFTVGYLASGVLFGTQFAWCLGYNVKKHKTRKDKVKQFFAVCGLILGWFPILFYFLRHPDAFKGRRGSKPKVLYECIGKGGVYEYKGLATGISHETLHGQTGYTLIWHTNGAGTRRDETISVYIDNATGKLIHHGGKNLDSVIIYADIDSGKYYHREEDDFDLRMMRLT